MASETSREKTALDPDWIVVAKVGAWEGHLKRPFHDQAGLFKSACFEILGLFSVLRDDWSIPERPEMTIKP